LNFRFWLPQLNYQIWILAAGRLLSQIGTGFTLFYAPIFFVNEVGLSATLVGIGLGSASVSGVLGRFLGGSFVDSQFWGRRRTLLLSAAISAIADVVLALTNGFPMLVAGNLLMGLGIGFYWPATEAAVADLTKAEQRNEAFALTRLADSVGLGLGVIFGGALIAGDGNYRTLFWLDGVSFIVFFVLIYLTIVETYHFEAHPPQSKWRGWLEALKDRRLTVYVLANILLTTYISQVQSTMPLYFKNFVATEGFSPTTISGLFSWHIVFAALCQLPVARFLNRFSRIKALMLSAVLWGLGFALIWLTGIVSANATIWAIVALGVLALATVAYTPAASSLVVDLSPSSLRGVYLSINSQCWAIGYLIGPPLGGWALDRSALVADSFWLAIAASVVLVIAILIYLDRLFANSGRRRRIS
jgi:MFS family permease